MRVHPTSVLLLTLSSVSDNVVSFSPVHPKSSFTPQILFSQATSDDAAALTTASDDDVTLSSTTSPTITTSSELPATALTPNLKSSLLLAVSPTDRGQNTSPLEKDTIDVLISELKSQNPTAEPTYSASSKGTWELIYSSTQLFRSSPFFMAGRAVCKTEEEAKQYDWFCDMHREALAISRIGKVRQIVSDTRIVSEFEVIVGAVPFLKDFTPFSYSGGWPVTITGSIVSSADITPTNGGTAWEIFMDTVEIKGSNIPLLRSLLDNGLQLSSRSLAAFLEENVQSYTTPRPIFETTYLDDELRVSRDQDGKVFVYAKTSDEVTGKDYADEVADLGLGGLLEGFKGAILNM